MFVLENHIFQPPSHPQNPRLIESSVLNACYDWLSKGCCINYKNLDREIETTPRNRYRFYPRLVSTIRISIARLKLKIDHHQTTTPPPQVSTIRISIARLKLDVIDSNGKLIHGINYKNLDREIETDKRNFDWKVGVGINYKNLDREIETGLRRVRRRILAFVSTIRISIARLKQVRCLKLLSNPLVSTIRISIARLKQFCNDTPTNCDMYQL